MVDRVQGFCIWELITQLTATKTNLKKNKQVCIRRFPYLILYSESSRKKEKLVEIPIFILFS